ncbi:MAG: hypothetical protein ACRDST_07875 [Pseudonocardiaceae bacterium]
MKLLEAGRSVLWAQTLNLRTDLTALAERAPELATRMKQIRTELDAPHLPQQLMRSHLTSVTRSSSYTPRRAAPWSAR